MDPVLKNYESNLNYGDYIRYYREDIAELTQQELAQRLDLCRKTISRYELCQTMPKRRTIKQIANVLQLDGDTLWRKCVEARQEKTHYR